MYHVHGLLPLAALALAGAAAGQVANAPCFESNLGSNLAVGNDGVATNNALGFTFPGPGGVQVTAIDIADNGFVWFSANPNARCCVGDGFQFTADPPSIAAMWEDLDPATATGGVFFNTIPAVGSTPARAVITWSQVRENGGGAVTAQLQLLSTGEIVISHDAGNGANSLQLLVGVTQGNGATANPVQFTAIGAGGLDTGTNATAYQEFSSGSYDLGGRSYEFIPNATGGYRILERSSCLGAMFTAYGTGCPAVQPMSFYEQFAAGAFDLGGTTVQGLPNGHSGYVLVGAASAFYASYANNLNLTDDSVSAPLTLPFTFQHPGGRTDVISVSSNGFVWLGPSGNDRSFSDSSILLSDPPSLAALWMDLNPDFAFPGGVFGDADPNGQAYYVTFAGVPEYNTTSANTFQIALFANGTFELRYPSAANLLRPAVVGYSTGNGAPDPGPVDLSAAMPFDTGNGGSPLVLEAASGSRPRLGTTFSMISSPVPLGTALGFMLFGFRSAATDLTSLGVAGCTSYIDLQNGVHVIAAFATPTTAVAFPLGVPSNASLIGVTVLAQSATFSPGFNPLGLIVSNGGRLRLGL